MRLPTLLTLSCRDGCVKPVIEGLTHLGPSWATCGTGTVSGITGLQCCPGRSTRASCKPPGCTGPAGTGLLPESGRPGAVLPRPAIPPGFLWGWGPGRDRTAYVTARHAPKRLACLAFDHAASVERLDRRRQLSKTVPSDR